MKLCTKKVYLFYSTVCFLFLWFIPNSLLAQEGFNSFNNFWEEISVTTSQFQSRSMNPTSKFRTHTDRMVYILNQDIVTLQNKKKEEKVSEIQFSPAITNPKLSSNFRYLEFDNEQENVQLKFRHAESSTKLLYNYRLSQSNNLNEIKWTFRESCSWSIDTNGNLVIEDENGEEYNIAPPTAYQTLRSDEGLTQLKIPISFRAIDNQSIGFTYKTTPSPNFRLQIEGNL